MKIIRDLNDEYGYTTILWRLTGPKLRVGVMNEGDEYMTVIYVYNCRRYSWNSSKVFMKYKNFPNDVNTGEKFY
jgi:pyruvate kinase